MLRDLRRGDAPQYFELMARGFPEESALLGSRPEELQKILRRVFRGDTRLVLGLLRLFGVPFVRILAVDVGQRLAATALVTFEPRSAYLSNVVVDAPYRRKGYARLMLEEARRTAARFHRPFVVLDVLESNEPARALYASAGYRRLRSRSRWETATMAGFTRPPEADRRIRPMERGDVPALVALARTRAPAEVEEVLPTGKHRFVGSAIASRILDSEERSWVIDRGHGPEGQISASRMKATEFGFLSSPVLAGSVEPPLAEALVATAGAWTAERGVRGLRTMVDDRDAGARSALEATGFRESVRLQTLFRPAE